MTTGESPRGRVAQTSAMLVLMPVFEADPEPEQYGYRPGRSAKDAVGPVHRLLHRGRNEVVDADLSNCFGEIPHAELMKSVARRLGQVSPAYKAVDRHATRRLRQWFRRKHKVRSGGYVRFPDDWLWDDCGLVRPGPTTGDLPWAKA